MIELPPIDSLALSLHHAPGTQALLVGSGLSRAANIPTGWEITLDLVSRLGALQGVMDHENWERWFRENNAGKEPNYSELLDALASTSGERRQILHDYIERRSDEAESRQPTQAHRVIARLAATGYVKVIVTTNFDRLIENALRDAGIEPTVIASEDAIAGAEPLTHARCTVIKVHGDYLDTRIKNTEAELASYGTAMNALLDQVFDNFGLTVVGWSGEWDTALRDAILRQPNRRYAMYWASRGKIAPLAETLLFQRGGRCFEIVDADTFFKTLEQQLEALKQASRPHPMSVEMAIGLAKRYCREDRFAMEWAEFLHSEAEKIRQYVSGSDYPKDNSVSALNGIVAAFMAKTEILRRACLICGRWGTEEANKTVAKTITSLVISHESGGGLADLASMRDFAASICFYWNMLGLLEQSKFKETQYTFTTKTEEQNKIETNLVSKLPFLCFDYVNWKFLSGRENRKTAISDFMLEKFSSEAKDILIAPRNAEKLFDAAEMLVCLSFARQRNKLVETTGISFWAPVGRFIWSMSSTALSAEIDRIANLPEKDPLIASELIGSNNHEAQETLTSVRTFFRAL